MAKSNSKHDVVGLINQIMPMDLDAIGILLSKKDLKRAKERLLQHKKNTQAIIKHIEILEHH